MLCVSIKIRYVTRYICLFTWSHSCFSVKTGAVNIDNDIFIDHSVCGSVLRFLSTVEDIVSSLVERMFVTNRNILDGIISWMEYLDLNIYLLVLLMTSSSRVPRKDQVNWSHYMAPNQCWPCSLTHVCGTRGDELKLPSTFFILWKTFILGNRPVQY